MTTILAVDPSIRNVGWAIHIYDKERKISDWNGGCLSFPEDQSIQSLSFNVCMLLDGLLKKYGYFSEPTLPSVLIVEKATFMSGTKGHIAAQKGYTLDLAFIAGYIVSHFRVNRFHPVIKLYTPQDWKGNVPKSATLAKYKRYFPGIKPPKTDHEVDAKMMIVHYLESL